MWPAIIGGAASVIGGFMGWKGQKDANAANAKQAQENRDFQERMSNTSFQRGKADLEAAGYNPGLAYQKGGADSPSGTTAHLDNTLAGAGSSARDAATSFATMAQARANTRLTNAQASQLEIESVDRAAAVANQAQTGRFDLAFKQSARPAQLQGISADAGAKEAQMRMAQNEASWQPWRLQRENEILAPLQMDLLRQQIGAASSNARSAQAQAALYELAWPGARNQAAAANTLWGRNISPYLNDANSVGKLLLPFNRR